jgi:predicted DNA-binding transcriptional regulator YafY
MDDGAVRQVSIWFAPEAELYVREQRWHKSQSITSADGGGVLLEMRASGLQEIASWVLSFGPRARAIAPPELVELVKSELRAATHHYS